MWRDREIPDIGGRSYYEELPPVEDWPRFRRRNWK